MEVKTLYKGVYDKPNILAVIHDFRNAKGGSVGGTTLHLMDIIEGLKKSFNFHVLYWSADTHLHHITSFFEYGEATRVLNNFRIERDKPWKSLYNSELKSEIRSAVDALNIDLIHVHHIKNLTLDIFDIAKERNIPLIYSIHDFYAACPSINMMRENNTSCHTPQNRDCKRCSKYKFGSYETTIKPWQSEFARCLDSASKIVAPANSTRDILKGVYPSLKIEVIEHGYDANPPIENKSRDKKIIDVAFIGSITKIKGLKLFLELIPLIKESNIRVHLFGTTHKVAVKGDGKNFFNHGRYNREDLPALLIKNDIDVVCLPSICAETFSYTLSESFLCNIPVIGLDIGAIAQRIRDIDGGWVVPVETTAKELFTLIEEIQQNRDNEYLQKVANLKANRCKLSSVADMCREYEKSYNSLISPNAAKRGNPSFFNDKKRFVEGIEVNQSGREEYRILRDRITSEDLSFKAIFKEIQNFRKRFPDSKLRNKITFKLLWHKLNNKKR